MPMALGCLAISAGGCSDAPTDTQATHALFASATSCSFLNEPGLSYGLASAFPGDDLELPGAPNRGLPQRARNAALQLARTVAEACRPPGYTTCAELRADFFRDGGDYRATLAARFRVVKTWNPRNASVRGPMQEELMDVYRYLTEGEMWWQDKVPAYHLFRDAFRPRVPATNPGFAPHVQVRVAWSLAPLTVGECPSDVPLEIVASVSPGARASTPAMQRIWPAP